MVTVMTILDYTALRRTQPSWRVGLFEWLLDVLDRRHQRAELAALSPRMLRDIGITVEERDRELGKLPWQA